MTVGNVFSFRTDIYVHAKDNVKIRRVIKAAKNAIIPPYFIIEISIKMKEDSGFFTNDRDYLFKLNRPNAYYYLINADFFFVQIRNDSDLSMKVSKGCLGVFKEFIEQECYHADSDT